MSEGTPTRSRARPPVRLGRPSLGAAVAQLSIVGASLATAEAAFAYSSTAAWEAVLAPAVACVYLAAGAIAWLRRPSNRMGTLMTASGFVWIAAGLSALSAPALVAVGLVAATVPLANVVHLLHAFPSGRLRGPLSVATVIAGYGACLVLQAPLYLFGTASGPAAVLQIADDPDLARIGYWVQVAVGAAVVAVTALVLARRLRAQPPARRHVSRPLFAYGIGAVIWIPVSGNFVEFSPWGANLVLASQYAVLAGVPVAFAVAVVRGAFVRSGEIEELGAWLSADDAGRPLLADALAGALGDPSLQVAFWVPEAGGHTDALGRPVSLPAAGSSRAAVEVTAAGRRIGAIVYDATLIGDPGVVRDAGRVIALALDRERLTVELRASRESLRRSRARIVRAADGERRRLAQSLHDGLQTRLVLLAVQADRVEGEPGRRLRAGLQDAIAELREFAQGIMPAVLTERGLYAAAEDLADRMPIPVELALAPDGRELPAAVETTGYFVLSEALTNAVKHSRARELRVLVARDNGHLTIEVRDDGIGGARANGGAGLRGIADRVDALGGRLAIESRAGAGTRLLAEVPCES